MVGWFVAVNFNKYKAKFRDLFALIVIGAIASAVDALVLWCIDLFHVPVWISGTIGYIVGTLVVYFLANIFVFTNDKSRSKPWLEITLFFAVGFVGLILNDLILSVFTNGFGFPILASKVVSIVTVFVWNTAGRYASIGIVRRKTSSET